MSSARRATPRRRSRGRRLGLAFAALASIAASPPPSAELDIAISGLRNQSGAVMLCLTQRGEAQYFDCAKDPARIERVVPSGEAGEIRIAGLAPGRYALLVVHDENRNGKLDKMLGLPREGFGFSRNPAIRMGPPAYGSVQFAVAGHSRQAVKVKYLL
ncbi:MAG: DUF2141 domain-containing protein [Sphingomonas bacterium]|nr:DUF2141 domain-containing protein [Sphingomonas bacterium]